MQPKEAVVVIPIYKGKLNAAEEISVQQAYRVLSSYDICFMAPEKLRPMLEEKGWRGEYFPDGCFGSVSAYSRLLLDKYFYERFSDYEYMLIYQLDALAFSDRLHEFCQLGYDYIGAPMRRIQGWPYNLSPVGNGGFSLRRISSCIKVLSMKSFIYSNLSMKKVKMLEDAEDRFFTYCGVSDGINFTIPSFEIALSFAMEHQIRKKCKELQKNKLPFGCHAWSKPYYYYYWREYVQACGYDMSATDVLLREKRKFDYYSYIVSPYLVSRLLRNKGEACRKIKADLPNCNDCIIWGFGVVGRRALKFFDYMGWKVAVTLDKGANVDSLNDISEVKEVKKPNKDILLNKNGLIVITTTKFMTDITKELIQLGLEYKKDFIFYSADVESVATRAYFNEYCIKWFRG